MTIKYCSECGTARQRNIVNRDGVYICLECMFFDPGLKQKASGRYRVMLFREVKVVLGAARKLMDRYCSKDDCGYYFVGDLEHKYLRKEITKILEMKFGGRCV